MGASIDFEDGKICLKRAGIVDHDPLRGRRNESRGTTVRASLTVFARADGRGKQESSWIRRKNRGERSPKQIETISPESEIKCLDSRLLKKTQIRHTDTFIRAVRAVSNEFGLPGNVSRRPKR